MFSPSPILSFGALCSEIVCEASLFLQLPVYFSVAQIAVESILPTVLGLPGRRHSRAQFYAPPGLSN